jgi:hypothetical protein
VATWGVRCTMALMPSSFRSKTQVGSLKGWSWSLAFIGSRMEEVQRIQEAASLLPTSRVPSSKSTASLTSRPRGKYIRTSIRMFVECWNRSRRRHLRPTLPRSTKGRASSRGASENRAIGVMGQRGEGAWRSNQARRGARSSGR